MRDEQRFIQILEEIEFALAERKQLWSVGPHIIIVERLNNKRCREIAVIFLSNRAHQYPLKLSRLGRLFVAFMAHHRHTPMTAAEIETGIMEFCTKRTTALRRQGPIHKRAVKVYVQRTRRAFIKAFQEAGIRADVRRVLVSEASETNVALYRLRCTAEFRFDVSAEFQESL